MAVESISNIVKSLNNKLVVLAENVDGISVPYLKELEGAIKQRIHNKGKDSDGNTIGSKTKRAGRYSPGYEKKKVKKVGESNLYPINLQYEGDLLRSFTVGNSQNKNVLRFQDDDNSNKAAWNEDNYNTEIYRPSEQELEDMEEVLRDSIEEFLRTEFNLIK